jgi:hypothetical protein
MARGNLTVADLARWLGRPDPTVRGWVQRGLKPMGPRQDINDLEYAVFKLEFNIKRKKGFPVPHMSQRDRIAYLKKLRG